MWLSVLFACELRVDFDITDRLGLRHLGERQTGVLGLAIARFIHNPDLCECCKSFYSFLIASIVLIIISLLIIIDIVDPMVAFDALF